MPRGVALLGLGVLLAIAVPGVVAGRNLLLRGSSGQPGGLLEVGSSGEPTFEAASVERAAAVEGVQRVEGYLMQFGDGFAVVGVPPGAPLRYLSGGVLHEARVVEAGRGLEPGDQGQAVTVLGITRDMGGMMDMGIPTDIGSTFQLLPGLRPRIVGRFSVPAGVEDHVILLPLDVLQEATGLTGRLTHLFVTPTPGAGLVQVEQGLQAALGQGVLIRQR